MNDVCQRIRGVIASAAVVDALGGATHDLKRSRSRSAELGPIVGNAGAGVEGAVWAPALASAALVVDGADEVLTGAASVLDPDGALTAAIALGTTAGLTAGSSSEGLDELHDAYGMHHWVHVLLNSATTAFALSRGRGDFGRSIVLKVSAGWDTSKLMKTLMRSGTNR